MKKQKLLSSSINGNYYRRLTLSKLYELEAEFQDSKMPDRRKIYLPMIRRAIALKLAGGN